ncbi:unnamed protein product [Spirodela intermedia]|uniref:Uncharacterized protein n=1 Tax=Spirodela intermedia TaxID=51605 RepID=A0A7I8JBM6_SPIIN|nr:unnamed protein product [Spirodela intermedia]CAA6666872.1 unnamed protein product [Spirodela intermedia]
MEQSGGAANMATQICHQISSVFSPPSPSPHGSPLDVLVEEIAAAGGGGNRVFVHGVGREGLMLRALCMRLYHLGLSAHVVAICAVARAAGGRVVLLTAHPDSGSEARRNAHRIAFLPAQTMADPEEDAVAATVRLPMGSLYEGAMFVLFEMAVIRLAELLSRPPRHARPPHQPRVAAPRRSEKPSFSLFFFSLNLPPPPRFFQTHNG